MANSTRNPTLEAPRKKLGLLGACSSYFVNPWLELQRQQWEALRSWQQLLATFNNDIWEHWLVRYAGGVPIDG
jgi:hypothetical protein